MGGVFRREQCANDLSPPLAPDCALESVCLLHGGTALQRDEDIQSVSDNQKIGQQEEI